MSNQGMFTMRLTWRQAQVVESALRRAHLEWLDMWKNEATTTAKERLSEEMMEVREILAVCFG